MTGFLLDTNVLSEFSRSASPPHTKVERWVESARPDALFTSVLTFGEIRKGIELLPPGRKRSELEQCCEGRRKGAEGEPCKLLKCGGQGRNRTADASLFRAALYRLSYLAVLLKASVYQTGHPNRITPQPWGARHESEYCKGTAAI